MNDQLIIRGLLALIQKQQERPGELMWDREHDEFHWLYVALRDEGYFNV